MDAFTKVVSPVETPEGRAFCKITWTGAKLSISGVIGPLKNGNARGSAGQIEDYLIAPDATPLWNPASSVAEFVAIWKEWHLNDMRAGCAHQRSPWFLLKDDEGNLVERLHASSGYLVVAELPPWNKRPIDPAKPTNSYGKHFAGQRLDSWNLLGWITQQDRDDGLLSRPCPVCGYKYGSAWLHENVPEDVLAWLKALPNTDVKPAWV